MRTWVAAAALLCACSAAWGSVGDYFSAVDRQGRPLADATVTSWAVHRRTSRRLLHFRCRADFRRSCLYVITSADHTFAAQYDPVGPEGTGMLRVRHGTAGPAYGRTFNWWRGYEVSIDLSLPSGRESLFVDVGSDFDHTMPLLVRPVRPPRVRRATRTERMRLVRGEHAIQVLRATHENGRPARGVRVALVASRSEDLGGVSSRILARGRTDRRGIVRLPVAVEPTRGATGPPRGAWRQIIYIYRTPGGRPVLIHAHDTEIAALIATAPATARKARRG